MAKRAERRRDNRVTHPVSSEALRSFARVPMSRRLDWIEEMIQLEAALPARVRGSLARQRALARRPAR